MPREPQPPAGDPLLERLERLSQRRAASSPGAPLPPPMSPQGKIRGAAMPAGPPIVDRPPQRAANPLPHAAPASARPAPKPRRKHPARSARVGALVASVATTGGLGYLFAGQSQSSASSALAQLPSTIPTSASTTASTTASTAPTTTAKAGGGAPTTTAPTSSSSTPTTAAAGSTAVAGFDGRVVETRYGPVQVQAQVSNGKLVDVAVVQYPNEDGKSVRINSRALPTLRTEALSAQSANVDTVSGATYTSDGYARSLQSALDEAVAAGVLTA